jgi:hypothetical protein
LPLVTRNCETACSDYEHEHEKSHEPLPESPTQKLPTPPTSRLRGFAASRLRVRPNIPLFAPPAIIRGNPCSSVAEKNSPKKHPWHPFSASREAKHSPVCPPAIIRGNPCSSVAEKNSPKKHPWHHFAASRETKTDKTANLPHPENIGNSRQPDSHRCSGRNRRYTPHTIAENHPPPVTSAWILAKCC